MNILLDYCDCEQPLIVTQSTTDNFNTTTVQYCRRCNKVQQPSRTAVEYVPFQGLAERMAKEFAEEKQTATKYDQGKPDLTLIRMDAITPIARVFAFGAKKYGRNNYLAGMSHLRLLAAASRHLMAYISGESMDPESGESHLAHLGCCTLMLLTYNANGLGTDDRDPNLTTIKK